MVKIKIAILMTCYNRKDTTIKCLSRLRNQMNINKYKIDLFVVDDASQDGTSEAILNIFPNATIIVGDGNLFWSGGMRVAFLASLQNNYDYFLWLNDDSMLNYNALNKLVETSINVRDKINNDVILAGSLADPKNNFVTYGGKRFNPLHPKKLITIQPIEEAKQCDVVNGNCVLITNRIAQAVGNLSPEFRHAGADYDYCLRAKKLGFSSWIAPGYIGTCPENPIKKNIGKYDIFTKFKLLSLSNDAIEMRIKDSLLFIQKYGKQRPLTYFLNMAYGIFFLLVIRIGSWTIKK
jgi:GT2 family glycosyltransferase